MDSSARIRNAFLTAVGVMGAVVLVAVAARGSTPAGEGGTRRPSELLVDILFSLYILMMIAGALLFLYVLYVGRASIAEGRAGRRDWRNWIGPILLVTGAMLLTRSLSERGLPGDGLTLPQPAGPGPASPTNPTGEAYEPEFAWIPVLVTVALVLIAAFGVWWSGRRRKLARGELRHDAFSEAVSAAVDESLDDLRAEPDPRRAVIAAYARLERVLAAHGLPRFAAEAPLEYLRRMLAELSVREVAAVRLTELFERAKFSQHAVGPEMKEQAIDALETVRDDLLAARALAEEERAELLEARRKAVAG